MKHIKTDCTHIKADNFCRLLQFSVANCNNCYAYHIKETKETNEDD